MKILIVHNNYGKYSGEESVVDKMAEMIQSHGHDVCFYRRSSKGARETLSGSVNGFFSGIYSSSGVKGLRKIIEKEKPDIVNVHNLYPFISPAALFECKKAGIPVIMTVHNFRIACSTGLFMREGMPCEYCLQKGNEWGCVKYNCEQSWPRTIGFAFRNYAARITGAFSKNVDAFACLTEFQRQKLIETGYDSDKIVVIPNSMDTPLSYENTMGNYVAYIGRLSYEKGYDRLIEIARHLPNIEFRFAGKQRNDMQEVSPLNVKLMGQLNAKDLNEFIKNSRFIVMPSRCYEGFPMTILEAASFGKPTIGPDHGGFTEIIGKGKDAIGQLFDSGDVIELEKQIISLWNNKNICDELGKKAFEKLKCKYSTEIVFLKWENAFKLLMKK